MAGHSKWANIKHRKSRQDAKRGKEFTKVIREITASVKIGGDSPGDNPRLRQAIDKALAVNMPRATIDRAVKRAAGGEEEANYEEIVYEGYGPGGSAVYIEVLTDNKNRTVAEIRHILSRYNGNLGSNGCAAHLFDKIGLAEVQGVDNEENLMNDALDAGATEIDEAGSNSQDYYVQCEPADLHKLCDLLEQKNYNLGSREVTMIAKSETSPQDISDEDKERMRNLYNALDDLDDVQNIYCNLSL